MSLFTEISSLVHKPDREFKKIYTQPDEIYIIWYTGYSIATCMLEAERYLYSKKTELQKLTGHEGFRNCLLQLQSSCNKLHALTPVIDEKNNFWDDILNRINKEIAEKTGLKEVNGMLHQLKVLFETEIHAYSTHLANVFLFGYRLIRLKTLFLYGRPVEKVLDEIGKTEDIITRIDKGDKSLNSPNLELVHENLRLIMISLELIRKNIKKLSELKRKNFALFGDKVEQCFVIWESILLDIKNPEEIIRGQFFVFVLYYYLLIIILGFLQLLYNYKLKAIFENTQVTEFLKNNEEMLIALIVPVLIWLIVLLYRKMRHLITSRLLRRRFFDIIRK